MAAIQLAKLLGGRVIASAGSDSKLELARKLGADALVNHHTGDVVAEVKRLTGKEGSRRRDRARRRGHMGAVHPGPRPRRDAS
jgi:NADPH:quinone reductase-like Zn-dependent oxidoreductase